MQRGVDRRARRGLLRRQAGLDLVERPGIVAELVGVRLEVGERGLGRLVVALDRRGLAVARDAVVLELDVDDVCSVLRAPRDDEGLGELDRRDPGREPHGGTLPPVKYRNLVMRRYSSAASASRGRKT